MSERPTPAAPADHVRRFIAETVSRAGIYASHAVDLAELGDDRGLARAVRMLAVLAVNAAETLPQLANAAAATERLNAAARTAAEARAGRPAVIREAAE